MSTKVRTFDVSEYLKDESSIAAYLSAVVEKVDPIEKNNRVVQKVRQRTITLQTERKRT